jgi:hypothetical protein
MPLGIESAERMMTASWLGLLLITECLLLPPIHAYSPRTAHGTSAACRAFYCLEQCEHQQVEAAVRPVPGT